MKKVIKIKAICPIEFAELNPADFFYLVGDNTKTLLMKVIKGGSHFNCCNATLGYLYDLPDDAKVIKVKKEKVIEILKKHLTNNQKCAIIKILKER